ncbi:hypothetical protein AB4Z48_17015 [Cupriavidus sp. 2TAF22]|uniref:hypothetical protein n=1 Tax=unclassified Cupriavidus TaxID=2640874 RepID=UPI003F8DA4F4
MNVFEAFTEIKHLPARERLLIGVSLNNRFAWSAGRIDDPSVSIGFESAVTRAIEEFQAGDRLLSIRIIPSGGGHIVVAMGAESAVAIIDAMTKGIDLISQRGGN